MKHILSKIVSRLPNRSRTFICKQHYRHKFQKAALTDEFELAIIHQMVGEADVVFDIGANFGLHTKFMSKAVGDFGEVHAFEPSNTMLEVLKNNICSAGMTNVIPNQVALSDREGEMTFYIPKCDNGSINFYEASLEKHTIKGEYEKFKVRTTSLAIYCWENKIDQVDYIKIDVEGHEIPVLKGAEKVIKTHKPAIFLEVNEPLDDGGHGAAVRDLILSFGYEVNIFDGQNILPWRPGLNFVNYLLLPSESKCPSNLVALAR